MGEPWIHRALLLDMTERGWGTVGWRVGIAAVGSPAAEG